VKIVFFIFSKLKKKFIDINKTYIKFGRNIPVTKDGKKITIKNILK
tara:strand:+ start:436 stop:573 length:138 start_codon:yes stop_codon:yes gene_type:complete